MGEHTAVATLQLARQSSPWTSHATGKNPAAFPSSSFCSTILSSHEGRACTSFSGRQYSSTSGNGCATHLCVTSCHSRPHTTWRLPRNSLFSILRTQTPVPPTERPRSQARRPQARQISLGVNPLTIQPVITTALLSPTTTTSLSLHWDKPSIAHHPRARRPALRASRKRGPGNTSWSKRRFTRTDHRPPL
jgi:hypothetical protein